MCALKPSKCEILATLIKLHPNEYSQELPPMNTSSSIHHRFDVEIPRGKFVEITLILKGESTWKL